MANETIKLPRADAEVIFKILKAASGAFRFGKKGRDSYNVLKNILAAPAKPEAAPKKADPGAEGK